MLKTFCVFIKTVCSDRLFENWWVTRLLLIKCLKLQATNSFCLKRRAIAHVKPNQSFYFIITVQF